MEGLTANTHQRNIKRVFDLVLETEADDALLSAAVEACNRLKHMEPLSQLLSRLPSMSSNVSAPIFQAMIKSFGQMGDVVRVRELWKQMSARGLQPGPFDVRLHGKNPGVKWAARRGSGADPRPCELGGDEALHQHRHLHHRSQRLPHGQACQGDLQHA